LITPLILFVASLTLLIYSSNKFIDSSEKVGLSLGISPFIIGVTIVAFGTSLPELATSIISVLEGSSEIVVGNVVGSNITNILLVLGLSTIAAGQIKINRNIMDVDIPLMTGSAVLLYFILGDLEISPFDTTILIIGMISFLLYTINNKEEEKITKSPTGIITYLIMAGAAVGVYFGAAYTVESVTELSILFDVDPSIISLGVLALGTSLPEIVVSVAAARRGIHEMAIGNVIGSNIFNTYAVMGIPSLVGPLTIPPDILAFSLPFMVAVTFLF
jgi:cation:H+ antiporter